MGSITLPKKLMEKVDLWPGEQVLVVSNTSGNRLWTYAIEGQDEHNICMNGASAHLIKKGEQIIIMAFAQSEKLLKPKNILVDEKNNFLRYFD